MAKFCFDCWRKIDDIDLTNKEVIISKDLDLCEGCGKVKRVIVCSEKSNILKDILGIFRKK